MDQNPPCPDHDQLAQLLAGRLPEDQEQALVKHVDHCLACQQLLEKWAFSKGSWQPIAEGLRQNDASQRDSALQQVLAKLRSDKDKTVDEIPRSNAEADSGPPLRAQGDVVQALGTLSESNDAHAFPERYQMSGEIARGGMGAVLKGRDTELGRDIAIKIMLENHKGKTDLLQRFVEEAQIGGQLQHPGIAPIYDMGRSKDKRPYFTMKLIKGQTLSSLLKSRSDPSQDVPKFLGIFEQICQTMAYAHSHGVIHRDLKPANIMVGAFGEVQVMDWGLAKVLPKNGTTQSRECEEADEATDIRTVRSEGSDKPTKGEAPSGSDTQAGSVLGTLAYMPPEQAKGEIHELDERCDVFGLGAVLCVILTGKPPYVGKDTSDVHRKAMAGDLNDAWQRLEQCGADRELIELTLRCLAVDQQDRPKNAGEVAETMTAYLESVQQRLKQAEIETAQAKTKTQEERKRQKVVLALAASILLLTFGISGAGLWYQGYLTQNQLLAQQDFSQFTAILNSAQEIHDQFDEKLRQPGGVFELQNDRDGWTEKIRQAKQNCRRAEMLYARIKDSLNTKLAKQMRDLKEKLDKDEEEWQFAVRLEIIRERRQIRVGNDFDTDYAKRHYPKAFDDNDLGVLKDDPQVVASRILALRINEQVIATLDDWAVVSWWYELKTKRLNQKPEHQHYFRLRSRLLQIAKRADDDPWSNRIRDARQWDRLRKDQKSLKQLIESMPQDVSPQLIDVVREITLKDSPARKSWLQVARTRYAQDFSINNSIATFLSAELDAPSESIGYYRAAVVIRPTSSSAYVNWGAALAMQRNYAEAITKFQQAIRINPKLAAAYANWGYVLSQQKKYAEAVAKCRQATQLDPKFALAFNEWGFALEQQNKYVEACALYQKAIQVDPHFAGAYNNWGSVLAAQKKYADAIAKYKQAIRINPKLAGTYNNWGLVLADQKKYAEAIAMYKQAIKANPKFAFSYANWGYALYHQKNYAEVDAKFQQAAEIDPNDARIYNGWGWTLIAQNKYAEACAKYQKATRIDPNFAEAYSNWGRALSSLKKYAEACAKFQEATRIAPKFAEAYIAWGRALNRKKDYKEAITIYRKVIREVDPAHYWAHNNLGWNLYHLGKLDDAIEYYRKAIILNPKNAHVARSNLRSALKAQYKQAVSLYARGDRQAAIRLLRKVVKIDPKHVQAYVELGYCLRNMRMLDEAAKALQTAIEIDCRYYRAHHNLGWMWFNKREYEKSSRAFRKAIELNSKYAYSHGGLGRSLLRQGRFNEAREALQRAVKLFPEGHKDRKGWERRLDGCKSLIDLEQKRLPHVLMGAKTDVKERIVLAYLCLRYLKRYRDAVNLFSAAFAKQRELAEDVKNIHRYNAACAAALAAAGKGKDVDKIQNNERDRLRQQGREWLEADLNAWNKLLQGKPLVAVFLRDQLAHWQKDPDLASIRDSKELDKLPKQQQQIWQQFWSDVQNLEKNARSQFSETTQKGLLTDQTNEQTHIHKLTTTYTYVIEMRSKQFDTYLYLRDAKGKLLAENDDIGAGNFDSRIHFNPTHDGIYRLVASSYQQRGHGTYEIVVREIAKSEAK